MIPLKASLIFIIIRIKMYSKTMITKERINHSGFDFLQSFGSSSSLLHSKTPSQTVDIMNIFGYILLWHFKVAKLVTIPFSMKESFQKDDFYTLKLAENINSEFRF